ncbi:hypothetical protein [Halalkalibacter urbisdiaboli]|uniref:hypothetical protein n=1 Tax=Halalkalibacter urbisdiaboli TaxID=1960589 RepID=UPI000B44D526|nr:hypothetical protein [Halalkalibacter urbisdiaboli]
MDLAAIGANGFIALDLDGKNPRKAIENQATVIAAEQDSVGIDNYFNGPPTKTMSQRWEMLHRSQMETFIDIIYGKKPIEAFDEYVENWYSSGGDDITKEVNEWYDSVK